MKKLQQLNRIFLTACLLIVSLFSQADNFQGAKHIFGENLLQSLRDGRQHTERYDNNSVTTTITCPDNNHPHAIDLGLPSGIKWACCNVGAEKPEGYGGFYAWSETETKDSYDWENYKYCVAWDGNSAWDWNRYSDHFYFTKYVTNDSYGEIDNKVILDSEDDAATVNFGAPWRMPTENEMLELVNLCEWSWETRNNVGGFTVTGPNGNHIFLPASGSYHWGTSIDDDSDEGFYYTSSLYTLHCKGALYLYFNRESSPVVTVFDDYFDRRDGRTVRGVIDAEKDPDNSGNSAITCTTDDIGRVVAVNGKIYDNVFAAEADGTTASGIIAYVGEEGTADESNSKYRGLAIALGDVESTNPENINPYSGRPVFRWFTERGADCISSSPGYEVRINTVNGITMTNILNGKVDGTICKYQNHYHEASVVAANYPTMRPDGASEWFLPSIGQWNIMIKSLVAKAGGTPSDLQNNTTINKDCQSSVFEEIIEKAGGIPISDIHDYWSSTPMYSKNFDSWAYDYESNLGSLMGSYIDMKLLVRCCFAFVIYDGGNVEPDDPSIGTISGQCGENVYYILSDDYTLKLYGTGMMYDYGTTNQPWSAYSTKIAALSIGEGITGISENAFCGCTALASVTLPASLKDINANAFQDCANLKRVTCLVTETGVDPSRYAIDEPVAPLLGINPDNLTEADFWYPFNPAHPDDPTTANVDEITDVTIDNVYPEEECKAKWLDYYKKVYAARTATQRRNSKWNSLSHNPYIKHNNSEVVLRNVYAQEWIEYQTNKDIYERFSVYKQYATVPVPTTDVNAFENIPLGDATLYVYQDVIDAYRVTDPWRNFGNILPIDPLAVDEQKITRTHDDENAPIYDLMGRRLANKPTKGIYIQGGKKYFAR